MNSQIMVFLPFASGCFVAFLLCLTAGSPRLGIPVMLAGLKAGRKPEDRRIFFAVLIFAAAIVQILIHRRLVSILTTDYAGVYSAVTHSAKMGEILGIMLGAFRIMSEQRSPERSID